MISVVMKIYLPTLFVEKLAINVVFAQRIVLAKGFESKGFMLKKRIKHIPTLSFKILNKINSFNIPFSLQAFRVSRIPMSKFLTFVPYTCSSLLFIYLMILIYTNCCFSTTSCFVSMPLHLYSSVFIGPCIRILNFTKTVQVINNCDIEVFVLFLWRRRTII